MSSSCASASIADSTAKTTCPRPYPRNAPDGGLFVYTASASIHFVGTRYSVVDSAHEWNSTPIAWLP